MIDAIDELEASALLRAGRAAERGCREESRGQWYSDPTHAPNIVKVE